MSASLVEIRATCVEYYGRYVGDGVWSPPNRCGSCPLYEPCVAKGRVPGRTFAELADAKRVFVAAARKILGLDR